jgi:hypothetical protein
VLGGCATIPSLIPDDARDPVKGAQLESGPGASGITVIAVAEEWAYSPFKLPEHVTPVRVRVANQRAESILISFSDVILTDEQGTRRAVLQPADAVQLAARAQSDLDAAGARSRTSIVISPGINIGGVGIGLSGIGLGGTPWPQNDPAYPGEPDRIETLRVGLRPGRLDPGMSVEGYLFFETPLEPDDRDRRFLITWDFRPVTPIDAPEAPPLARVEVPLVAR